MILLEPGNRILADNVSYKIKSYDPKEKKEAVDIRLCDLDGVSYRVYADPAAPSILLISMALPCWNEIKGMGGQDALEKHYGALVTDPQQDFDITLKIELDKLPMPADELVNRISLFKSNIVGGVFARHFTNLAKGAAPEAPCKFNLRPDTRIYIFSSSEKVTVIFDVSFTERVDIAVAKVFLQEFVESRRHLGAAPPCLFSVNPPLELKHFNITEPNGGMGFISFALQKSHVDGVRLEKAVTTIQMFRNYLQYHIKCSKAHFHARMRARVRSLLKVLNRAKQEQDDAPKKTISGKTFIRK